MAPTLTRRLLAVHAHPDDESITMGGTLACYAAQGAAVTVVTATLGEQGEIIPADLAGLAADAGDQLGGYRLTELRSACAALGVGDHRMLGGVGRYRDSGMAGSPSAGHPRAFVRAAVGGPEHAAAVAALAAVIKQTAPQVVLSYDADGGYGHPDHVAAHQVAVAAAAACGVPRVLAVIRPRSVVAAALADLPVPVGYRRAALDDLGSLCADEQVAFAIPVGHWAAARRAALAAHRTQLDLLPGGFALTNGLAQPLLAVEYYRLLAGAPPAAAGSDPTDDLFAGLA